MGCQQITITGNIYWHMVFPCHFYQRTYIVSFDFEETIFGVMKFFFWFFFPEWAFLPTELLLWSRRGLGISDLLFGSGVCLRQFIWFSGKPKYCKVIMSTLYLTICFLYCTALLGVQLYLLTYLFRPGSQKTPGTKGKGSSLTKNCISLDT